MWWDFFFGIFKRLRYIWLLKQANTMADKHANSRIVTLFRAGSNLARAQGKAVEGYYQNSKISVGSYFEKKTSKKVASGLTVQEEKILLPEQLRISADDRDFHKTVNDFYCEMDTAIDPLTGTSLEIGLELDNDSPVTAKNFPISLMDYLRYRHVKGHPYMAQNKEEAESNTQKQYYIFDKVDSHKKVAEVTKEKDAAMQLYLQLKKDPKKVDMMLTLLGQDPRNFTGKTATDDKIEALRKIATDDATATKFVTTYNEEDLEVQYQIETMIRTGIIKKIHNKYYDAETDKEMGASLEETIFFFREPANSEKVVMLKARMQEAILKPIDLGAKQTIV